MGCAWLAKNKEKLAIMAKKNFMQVVLGWKVNQNTWPYLFLDCTLPEIGQ